MTYNISTPSTEWRQARSLRVMIDYLPGWTELGRNSGPKHSLLKGMKGLMGDDEFPKTPHHSLQVLTVRIYNLRICV